MIGAALTLPQLNVSRRHEWTIKIWIKQQNKKQTEHSSFSSLFELNDILLSANS